MHIMEQFKVKFAPDPTKSIERVSSFKIHLQDGFSEDSVANKLSDISNNNAAPPIELHDAPRSFEHIHNLLFECESYINWVDPATQMSEEYLQRHVDLLNRECIQPNERYETDVLFKYNALEHISYLGALCFFYIQLNDFHEAAMTIEKAKQFVIPVLKKGFLLPIELVDSFDYVWVFLRLQAFVREVQKTGRVAYFPDIDIAEVPKYFSVLDERVQAGVLGLKYYFQRLQKVHHDKHIEVLRMAVRQDPSNYEWHYCLQASYRCRRKDLSKVILMRSYDWEDEVREISLANKLSVNNPRCMLRRIQLLAEIIKFTLKDQEWTEITFGEMNFQSMVSIKSYLQEQASKIMAICPKSVKVRIALADIFSIILPKSHRNHRLAKECLVQNLKNFPACPVANYRMGLHYLNVEANYPKAEKVFLNAYKLDDRDFGFFTTLVFVMMRRFSPAKIDELIAMIEREIYRSHWDRKQKGILHFIKAVALLTVGTGYKSKGVVDEFVKAYRCSEESLLFSELPNMQRKYGWPLQESQARLSLEAIKGHIARVDPSSIDIDRKYILARIIQFLDLATIKESKSSNKRQR